MNLDKKAIWENHIKNYRASKLSAATWCKQNQISVHVLRNWITRFNKENRSSSVSNGWISVEIPSSKIISNSATDPSGICINIGRASIEVTSTFNPEALEAVVRILSNQC